METKPIKTAVGYAYRGCQIRRYAKGSLKIEYGQLTVMKKTIFVTTYQIPGQREKDYPHTKLKEATSFIDTLIKCDWKVRNGIVVAPNEYEGETK